MKKIKTILIMALLIAALAVMPVFAASEFRIVRTAPENGAKNTTKDNMCVKIFFSTEVGNKASREANKDAFKITDNKGKEIPSLIYYSDKDPKYVLILVDANKVTTVSNKKSKNTVQIKDDTEYTVTLSKDFRDNEGRTLGEDANRKISFRTMNQRRGTGVYMVMMIGLFIGMFVFSARQMANQGKKPDEDKEKAEAFNPYKEAKRTGKSVEEVIKEHEKEEEKAARKKKKKSANKEKENPEEIIGRDGDAYRVSRPRPISEGGGTFISGKKAVFEEAERKREEEKARRKAENYAKKEKKTAQNQNKSGSKNSKKKKKGNGHK